MKVYCVFQSSGSYEDYFNELKGIFKDEKDAIKLKEELDKSIIYTEDECYNILPKKVFLEEWPYKCINEEKEIWIPEESYKDYTIEQYNKQDERFNTYMREYHEATIEEHELQ